MYIWRWSLSTHVHLPDEIHWSPWPTYLHWKYTIRPPTPPFSSPSPHAVIEIKHRRVTNFEQGAGEELTLYPAQEVENHHQIRVSVNSYPARSGYQTPKLDNYTIMDISIGINVIVMSHNELTNTLSEIRESEKKRKQYCSGHRWSGATCQKFIVNTESPCGLVDELLCCHWSAFVPYSRIFVPLCWPYEPGF